MKEHINGPVNYVRLEGQINNIKKVFYIFMDKHFDLEKQTRCDNFDSKDISNYLYRKIKKTKTGLDFFMEIRNEQISEPLSNKRGRYIEDVINLFKSEYLSKKDKISYAKSNKHVRLHYLDIRDYFNLAFMVQKIKIDINEIITEFKPNKTNSNLHKALDKKVIIIDDYLKKIKEQIILSLNKNNNNDDRSTYYLNKIINKYHNKDLQNHLINYLKENTENYFKKILTLIQLFNKKKEYLKNNTFEINNFESNINELKNIFSAIFYNIVLINSVITDVYLLRRILDKDYVKKGIIYSGFAHSINYIEFLVKKYNFNITYVYFINDLNKNALELSDKIKDYTNEQISKIFAKNDQCIDINNKDDNDDKNDIIN